MEKRKIGIPAVFGGTLLICLVSIAHLLGDNPISHLLPLMPVIYAGIAVVTVGAIIFFITYETKKAVVFVAGTIGVVLLDSALLMTLYATGHYFKIFSNMAYLPYASVVGTWLLCIACFIIVGIVKGSEQKTQAPQPN